MPSFAKEAASPGAADEAPRAQRRRAVVRRDGVGARRRIVVGRWRRHTAAARIDAIAVRPGECSTAGGRRLGPVGIAAETGPPPPRGGVAWRLSCALLFAAGLLALAVGPSPDDHVPAALLLAAAHAAWLGYSGRIAAAGSSSSRRSTSLNTAG